MIARTLAAATIGAVLLVLTWYEVSIWRECRATNSVLYCIRILGR